MASYRTILIAAVACLMVLGVEKASCAREQCPSVCTQEYAPVCGRRANGSTREFSNQCALGVHQCNNPGDIVSSRPGRC
ncbi:turripeptide Ici9.1 [Ischnura elegans]|uniref:turripeptide Ici9.1 n=1 Tax=Ischnura elegans TaxID=197161 RepID=UPI001ED87D1C|nr:turripeptide Ici9.1 [Ischnura elegans]